MLGMGGRRCVMESGERPSERHGHKALHRPFTGPSPALLTVCNGALHLLVRLPFLQVLAFVCEVLSTPDRQADLHAVALPIEGEGNQCLALDVGEAFEPSDLAPVQEQFAWGLGDVVVDVAVGILVDVGAVKPCLTLLDPGEGLADLAAAGPEGFDLGSTQDESCLKGFEDLVVPTGLGILKDVRHGKGGGPKTKKPEMVLRLQRGRATVAIPWADDVGGTIIITVGPGGLGWASA